MVDTGLMGNLGRLNICRNKYSHISNDDDYLEFWLFKNGNSRLLFSSLGRGDYREIVKTLLRNFVIGLFALIIIILKPLFIFIQYFFNTSLKLKN